MTTTRHVLALDDPARRSWSDPSRARPLAAHVLMPRGEGPHPVVLLSHGTGGSFSGLDWLARALAEAGFIVAGVDHHGNSWTGEYLAEGFAFVWERPRDLSVLLDRIAATLPADLARVGAAGFSAGGYAVAALLGARLDAELLRLVLTGALEAPPVPEFPDLMARLRERHGTDELRARALEGAATFRDERVRAGLLLAPALGSLVDSESLRGITDPVELRWGDADDNMPAAQNALVLREAIATSSGSSVGADVGHYVFLDGEPDPTGVRGQVAADAVAFFTRTLRG